MDYIIFPQILIYLIHEQSLLNVYINLKLHN